MNALTVTLTEMQADYVREVCKGTRPTIAARLAGYRSPDASVQDLNRNPQVQAAIASELRRFLYAEAAPAALQLLYSFMTDEQRDPKLRVACAKTLADRAGFIAPKARDTRPLDEKSFVDMTADELREASARIVKELGDRAVVTLDNAPVGDADITQDIDIFS